jgi:undecaprenyl pyrophosphate synthase
LFREYLQEAKERQTENEQKGFRLRYIGEKNGLPQDILDMVKQRNASPTKRAARGEPGCHYGGRQES